MCALLHVAVYVHAYIWMCAYKYSIIATEYICIPPDPQLTRPDGDITHDKALGDSGHFVIAESRFGERRRRLNDGTPTNGQGEVASTASTPLPYLGQSTTSINHAGRPVLPSHNNQRLLPQGYSSPQDQYGNPGTDSHNSRGNVQYSQYHEQPQTQQYNQYNYRPQNQNRRGYTPDEYMWEMAFSYLLFFIFVSK